MLTKIGCCGFPSKRRDYVTQFPVVEIQQTFYQPPRMDTTRRWRQELPPPFEFTVKAWQLITHEAASPTYRRLKTVLEPEERRQAGGFQASAVVRLAWKATRKIALILKARVILFQCPARFGPTPENLVRMRNFFEDLDRDGFTLAWEPRGQWPHALVADLCRRWTPLPPRPFAPYRH